MQSQWQPIETAPKDGTIVLLFDPSSSRWTVNTAAWRYDWWKPTWETVGGGKMILKATHWMPLPEPPK